MFRNLKIASPLFIESSPCSKIERDSFRAALMTSFEYVGNDLRKKSKQFFIIVTTVFLTVSFMTFLSLIGQLSPL